jgi:tetratricopeptide (TPR) repeat protein
MEDSREGSLVRKTAKAGVDITIERVGEHEWRFQYPRLDGDVYEEFHAALELMDEGDYGQVLGRLRSLIKRFPEFIDARHHLALALKASDTGLEYIAAQEWRSAVNTGLAVLPPEFVIGRDLLEWGWLENRPFLRACNGLALDVMGAGQTGEALAMWQDLLDLNPNDNQGIRSLLVDCLFARRRPVQVLAICDRYPGDGMPALLFGRVLALFMLERREEAAASLAEAARFAPMIAKELTKKTHPAPRDLHPGFVTMGGADEAYYYWRDSGESWKRTPGALEFVRRALGTKGADA